MNTAPLNTTALNAPLSTEEAEVTIPVQSLSTIQSRHTAHTAAETPYEAHSTTRSRYEAVSEAREAID